MQQYGIAVKESRGCLSYLPAGRAKFIRAKLLDELADLTAFRLHAEKVLGELYGNAQAYKL